MTKRLSGLGLVSFLLPLVIVAGCGGATGLTESKFKNLLTAADIQSAATREVKLETKFFNYKERTAQINPAQVKNIKSSFGMIYQTEDESKTITLNIVEFDSETLAQQYLEKAKNESELEVMARPIADISLQKEFNSRGLGSIVSFKKGNLVAELLSSMPDGEAPLVTATKLEELARKVESRL